MTKEHLKFDRSRTLTRKQMEVLQSDQPWFLNGVKLALNNWPTATQFVIANMGGRGALIAPQPFNEKREIIMIVVGPNEVVQVATDDFIRKFEELQFNSPKTYKITPL
jgi:hypothetical protein